MPNKEIYEYAIIRVVPKVEREEFINVGVILLSKKKQVLCMKYHLDKERLLAFSKEIDIQLIKEYLEAWKLVCDGHANGGKIGSLEIQVRFRWLTANRSTIIQSSPVHPGRSEDPSSELDKLFSKFILQEK